MSASTYQGSQRSYGGQSLQAPPAGAQTISNYH